MRLVTRVALTMERSPIRRDAHDGADDRADGANEEQGVADPETSTSSMASTRTPRLPKATRPRSGCRDVRSACRARRRSRLTLRHDRGDDGEDDRRAGSHRPRRCRSPRSSAPATRSRRDRSPSCDRTVTKYQVLEGRDDRRDAHLEISVGRGAMRSSSAGGEVPACGLVMSRMYDIIRLRVRILYIGRYLVLRTSRARGAAFA